MKYDVHQFHADLKYVLVGLGIKTDDADEILYDAIRDRAAEDLITNAEDDAGRKMLTEDLENWVADLIREVLRVIKEEDLPYFPPSRFRQQFEKRLVVRVLPKLLQLSSSSRKAAQETSLDQDQQDVRPTANKTIVTLRRGSRVTTLRGAGKISDVIFTVGEWTDGHKTLAPPQIVVELDEPWDGEIYVTTLLHKLKVSEDEDALFDAVKKLWPDEVQDEPAMTLRPTVDDHGEGKGKLTVSEMVLRSIRRK